jgi:hypothetical protein
MTMSRSSLRIRCTHSMVASASLAGLHREVVVVLVLEVAGLVRPQTGQRVRNGDDSRPTVETVLKSTV